MGQFQTTESPIKMMTNVFYFMFCLDLLVMWKKGLIRRLRLNLKCMWSQTEQQISTIHILSNIPRGKGNQMIKFGQLVEYNVANDFLEKSYRK